MNNRRMRIWIALMTGLALAAMLLLVSSAAAGPSPPETSVTQPQAASSNGAWSSGWQPIAPDTTQTFHHNLGGDPDDYAVEVWFRDTDAGGLGINRLAYGGAEANGTWFGAFWERLTTNTVDVYRFPNDQTADEVLVRVWVAPPPTTGFHDSGWQDIAAGTTVTFTHNVAITAADLTVGLWFSGTNRGIHHHGFGGLAVDVAQELWGAHWHNLTDHTVQVTRLQDDTDVEQVRVIVVQGDAPDYDSLVDLGGWQSIAQDQGHTFTHNLGWNPSLLLVRAECYDPVSAGINLVWAGGSVQSWGPNPGGKGAHIYGLTANTVTIHRWRFDDVCPQVRVRIWKRSVQVYLPLVLSNY